MPTLPEAVRHILAVLDDSDIRLTDGDIERREELRAALAEHEAAVVRAVALLEVTNGRTAGDDKRIGIVRGVLGGAEPEGERRVCDTCANRAKWGGCKVVNVLRPDAAPVNEWADANRNEDLNPLPTARNCPGWVRKV